VAARGNRFVFAEHGVAVGLDRMFVAMLDQQPVVALVVLAPAHAHQRPTALELLAVQDELDLALCQAVLRRARAFELPIAAVPHLPGAAAILALRDRALEIAVIERMVFDFDCEALVMWVE